MKLELAQLLSSQSDDLNLIEDYSGRGMFGANTAAVSGSFQDFMEAVGLAFESLSCGEHEGISISDLSGALSKISYDSLGRDMVLY